MNLPGGQCGDSGIANPVIQLAAAAEAWHIVHCQRGLGSPAQARTPTPAAGKRASRHAHAEEARSNRKANSLAQCKRQLLPPGCRGEPSACIHGGIRKTDTIDDVRARDDSSQDKAQASLLKPITSPVLARLARRRDHTARPKRCPGSCQPGLPADGALS
jgi:hypothetical protein